GSGKHACRVALGERLAVKRIAVDGLADTLAQEKSLDAGTQVGLAPIFVPPGIVDRPVADGAPGVVAEGCRVAVAVEHGRHVEVRAFRGQRGLGARDGVEELAADVSGLGPEGAVFGRPPAGPELVEGGQMVGGVGEALAGAVDLW